MLNGADKASETSLRFSSDGSSVTNRPDLHDLKIERPTITRRGTFTESQRRYQSQAGEFKTTKTLQLPKSLHSAIFGRFDQQILNQQTVAKTAEEELAAWVDRYDPDLPPAAIISTHHEIKKGQSDRIYFQLEWFWYRQQKWQDRLKMMLFLLLFITAVAHFVVGLYFLCTPRFFNDGEDPIVCTSPKCLRAAEYILDQMDMTVDPCTDFYQFVCGKQSIHVEATENHKLMALLAIATKRVIFFDFRRSQFLGDLFKKLRDTKYGHKVLKFYEACLDRNRREKESLAAFLTILQSLKLDQMDKLKDVQVEELFALWLLKTPSSLFSLIHRRLMSDVFVVTYNTETKSFEIKQSSPNAITTKLRLMPFAETFEVVKKTLLLVRKELDLENDEELETMAKDVTCIEINGGVQFDNYTDSSDEKPNHCTVYGASYRDQMNKFGSDQTLLGGFNYDDLIGRIIPVLSKETGLNFENVIQFDPKQENYFKKDLIENFFKTSTKRRVARFLQWILYRLLYEHLTWDIFLTFTNTPAPRYTKTWEFQCLGHLYTFFPEITLQSYLEANKNSKNMGDEDQTSIGVQLKSVQLINQRATLPERLKKCPNFNEDRAASIRQMLSDTTLIYVNATADLIENEWILKELNDTLVHTPVAMIEMSTDHLTNLFGLSLWSRTILKQTYLQTRSTEFQRRTNINTLNTVQIYTAPRALYPPNCLLEQPYFDNDIYPLNLAGYGAIHAVSRFQHHLYVIHENFWDFLPEDFLPPKFQKFINGTFFDEHKRTKGQLIEDEIRHFTKAGSPEQNFHLKKYGIVDYLSLQLTLEVLLQMHDIFEQRHPDKVRVLGGSLRNFTGIQLFFIQLVRNNCRDFTFEELELLEDDKEGSVIYNVVLGNNARFSKTWKCSNKSRMRRSGAMNFFQPEKPPKS